MQPVKEARYHSLPVQQLLSSLQEMVSLSELKTPCRCFLYMMWLLGLVNSIQNLPKRCIFCACCSIEKCTSCLGSTAWNLQSSCVTQPLDFIMWPLPCLWFSNLFPQTTCYFRWLKASQNCACVMVSRHISSMGSLPLLAFRAGYISRRAEGKNMLLWWLRLINSES